MFVGHDLYKKEVAKCSELLFIIFAAVQALKTVVRKCENLLSDFSAQSGKSTNVVRKTVRENGAHGRK